MPNADMMLLGTYRGFELNIRFDRFKNEHQAVLRAELSYPVSLGDDARGNITRLDNAILSSSILQKNPIRVSLSVSVTSCSPPAIPKRPADIVDEDKRTRYTEDGSGIRSNP